MNLSLIELSDFEGEETSLDGMKQLPKADKDASSHVSGSAHEPASKSDDDTVIVGENEEKKVNTDQIFLEVMRNLKKYATEKAKATEKAMVTLKEMQEIIDNVKDNVKSIESDINSGIDCSPIDIDFYKKSIKEWEEKINELKLKYLVDHM